MIRQPLRRFCAFAGVVLLPLGCSREPRIDVHKVYPPPRLAVAAVHAAGRVRYEATTGGFARIELGRGGSRTSAEVPVTSGWLRVDANDVRSLTGELEFDASQLKLTEQGETLDRSLGQRLLELGQAPMQQRVRFQVLSVDPSAEAVARRRTRRGADEPNGELRVAALTARGSLELHGFRAVRETALELTFEFPTRPGPPEGVTVTSKRPLVLRPSSFGLQAAPGEKALAKLLDSATVSVHARFLPRGE